MVLIFLRTLLARGKDAKVQRRSASLRDPSLPDEDRSATTRAQGGREGSVLSSQMGRNGYKDGRQSDYGFNDGFDLNADNELFDDVPHDELRFDGPVDDQHGVDWPSKRILSFASFLSISADSDNAILLQMSTRDSPLSSAPSHSDHSANVALPSTPESPTLVVKELLRSRTVRAVRCHGMFLTAVLLVGYYLRRSSA